MGVGVKEANVVGGVVKWGEVRKQRTYQAGVLEATRTKGMLREVCPGKTWKSPHEEGERQ